MAGLRGNAGGSKQNSNLSISLTKGNLESQLESIKNKANITQDAIQNIVNSWNALQEMVSNNKITLNEATDMMKDYLKEYDIKIDDTTKRYETQRQKIKDIQQQSKVSTKEEIKDQDDYANSINRVNELLNEQANLLNRYRASATNRLTADSIDRIITQIGTNLNTRSKNDTIKNDILRSIGYVGTVHSMADTLKDNNWFFSMYEDRKVGIPKDISNTSYDGKYNYGSNILKGLKNPNILPDINDLLAMAILNEDEFENYAKSQPDYDDLWKDYDRFQARLWNSGPYKGRVNDTDAFSNYYQKAYENKEAFLNTLDRTSDFRTSFGMTPSMRKAFQDFYYQQELENRPPRNMNNPVPLYPLSYYENNVGSKLSESVEKANKEIVNNIDKINQTTQQTANEISAKAQQATPTIEKAKNSLEDVGKRLPEFFSSVVSVFSKISKDLSMTFRDFGNAVRTWSSVMYSAIHLVQALENVMSVSDSMTAISYRLDRYDTTGVSRDTLLKRAFNQANETRSDVDSFATLAQRILATGVTKGNADQAMRLASLITKSMVLGGSTAQEQRSAQLQLSQALSSNILGGDELRAIRENAIGFTDMLARGLTRGYERGILTNERFANVNIGDLKQLGKEQLLTTDVVITAISLMQDEINRDFSTMPELFSQTMAKLMNTFKQRLNEFNQEGKGLGRIVKLFQDLEKWLNSDKGKQTLNKLMNILDKFIDFLTNIASVLGQILDSPVGDALMKALEVYLKIKPWAMGAEILFGKTDMYGNQRAGILGYGGFANVLTRGAQLFASKGNPLVGLFSAENVNGQQIAMGGLLPNILSMGISLINTLTGSHIGSNFAGTVFAQHTILDLLSKSNAVNASSLYETLRATNLFKQATLDTAFIDNITTAGQIAGKVVPSQVAGNLLNQNVFSNLTTSAASTAVGTAAGKGAVAAMGAKGGIIGKALGLAAAHPIAAAIAVALAGLSIGVTIRNAHDKKADAEFDDKFFSGLPSLNGFNLSDESKSELKAYANNWKNAHTKDKFWGGTEATWTAQEYDQFVGDYLKEAHKRVEVIEEYIPKISAGVADTAKNTGSTAKTVDVIDAFIRNMNDIQTRSFRGQLLMSGNTGVQNSWNVVVHNQSDLKDVANQIQQAVISAQQALLTK